VGGESGGGRSLDWFHFIPTRISYSRVLLTSQTQKKKRVTRAVKGNARQGVFKLCAQNGLLTPVIGFTKNEKKGNNALKITSDAENRRYIEERRRDAMLHA